MDRLRRATIEELSQINEIGPIIAKSVYDFLHSERGQHIIEELRRCGVKMTEDVPEESAPKPLAGKSIVVTGTLKNYTRQEIEELIERLGGHAASSVSRNTDFVLVGENPGSKLDKARALGVPTITEEEFEAMIGKPRR